MLSLFLLAEVLLDPTHSGVADEVDTSLKSVIPENGDCNVHDAESPVAPAVLVTERLISVSSSPVVPGLNPDL